MEGRGMAGIDSVGTERFINVVVFFISLPLHLRRCDSAFVRNFSGTRKAI